MSEVLDLLEADRKWVVERAEERLNNISRVVDYVDWTDATELSCMLDVIERLLSGLRVDEEELGRIDACIEDEEESY